MIPIRIHIPFAEHKQSRIARHKAMTEALTTLLNVTGLDECAHKEEIVSFTYKNKKFKYNGTMIDVELPPRYSVVEAKTLAYNVAWAAKGTAEFPTVWYQVGEAGYVIHS